MERNDGNLDSDISKVFLVAKTRDEMSNRENKLSRAIGCRSFIARGQKNCGYIKREKLHINRNFHHPEIILLPAISRQ